MTYGNPRQVEGLEVNEAEDGLVVFDPETDTVHHLNASASLIFELCDGSRDADAIATVVGDAYALPSPPRDEVLAGLADLAERKVIGWPAAASA